MATDSGHTTSSQLKSLRLEVKAYFNSTANYIEKTFGQLKLAHSKVDSLKTIIVATQTDVHTVMDDVSGMKDVVTTMQVESDLKGVENHVYGMKDDIMCMQNEMSGVKDGIEELEIRTADMQDEIMVNTKMNTIHAQNDVADMENLMQWTMGDGDGIEKFKDKMEAVRDTADGILCILHDHYGNQMYPVATTVTKAACSSTQSDNLQSTQNRSQGTRPARQMFSLPNFSRQTITVTPAIGERSSNANGERSAIRKKSRKTFSVFRFA